MNFCCLGCPSAVTCPEKAKSGKSALASFACTAERTGPDMRCDCPCLLLLRQHLLQIEGAWQHKQKASSLLYGCQLTMLRRALRGSNHKALLLCVLAGDIAEPPDMQ